MTLVSQGTTLIFFQHSFIFECDMQIIFHMKIKEKFRKVVNINRKKC